MENPIKIDDLRVPLFSETLLWGLLMLWSPVMGYKVGENTSYENHQ